jgi:hypothetical protein
MTYVGQTIDDRNCMKLNIWTSLRRHPLLLCIIHIQIPRLLALRTACSRRRWIHHSLHSVPEAQRFHHMADNTVATWTGRAWSIPAECRQAI